MINILDINNRKLAEIHDDETIWSVSHVKLGRFSADDIYDNDGSKAGHLGANGYVFNEMNKHVGTVRNTGDVYDIEGHHVGRVVGGHMGMGGAALLLIVR